MATPNVIKKVITFPTNYCTLSVNDTDTLRLELPEICIIFEKDLTIFRNLIELVLIADRLKIVEKKAFDCLDRLQTFELQSRSLKYLESDAFAKLVRLRVLFLNLPELEYIPDGLLRSCSRLERVKLLLPCEFPNDGLCGRVSSFAWINCHYTEKFAILFHSPYDRLNVLRLKNVQVDDCFISYLVNLGSLFIGQSEFVTITEDTEPYKHNLKSCVLWNTRNGNAFLKRYVFESLTYMDNHDFFLGFEGLHIFKMHRNLEILNVSKCVIREICFCAFKFNRLAAINLSRNRIIVINLQPFEHLRSLRHLNLSFNEISNFVLLLSQSLLHLKTFNLAHNYVSGLELAHNYETATFPSLELFDFVANRINFIRSNFFTNMPNMKYLHLAKNYLKKLSGNYFGNLAQLTVLNLQQNVIYDVSRDAFLKLINLKVLNMMKNGIQNLEIGTFRSLTKLTYLNLSFNNLNRINKGMFETNVSLKTLLLNSNKIKCMDMTDFLERRMNFVDVSKNFLPEMFINSFVANVRFNYYFIIDYKYCESIKCNCKSIRLTIIFKK